MSHRVLFTMASAENHIVKASTTVKRRIFIFPVSKLHPIELAMLARDNLLFDYAPFLCNALASSRHLDLPYPLVIPSRINYFDAE